MAVASAVVFAVGVVFHFGVKTLAPSIQTEYENAELFRPWAGWTSTYMLVHPFLFGVIFSAVYLVLNSPNGPLAGWRGGAIYGAGVFLVGSLPVFLLAFASFKVSPEVIGCWVAQNLCQCVAAGAAIGALAAQG